MKIFKDNRYYPQNFYINADIEDAKYTIICITKEAKKLQPNLFNGDCDAFVFALRYVPPYKKIHDEVRRLQNCAAEHKRFTKSYKGYIVLDISDWENGGFREDNISEFLKVLKAQSENWKYIFTTKNLSQQSKDELLNVLEDLWVNEVECLVQKLDFNIINNHLQEEYNISFQSNCKPVVNWLLDKVLDNKSAEKFMRDIVNYYNGQFSISKDELIEYLKDRRTYACHLIAEKSVYSIKHLVGLSEEKEEKNE